MYVLKELQTLQSLQHAFTLMYISPSLHSADWNRIKEMTKLTANKGNIIQVITFHHTFPHGLNDIH